MDRFEAMRLFVEVVDQGSFSAAGRAVRVPVPTLSRKVSELEDLLGAKLLVRTTRKLSLTDTGATYVQAARRILEQVDEAPREAAGEFLAPKGDLVLTAPVSFGRLHVLPVVCAFLALYPEINVRLLLSDRNADLIDDAIDMAVRIGRLPDSTMVATRIGAMLTIVCASPELVSRHGSPRTPDDLQRFPCVTFDSPLTSSTWRFGSAAAGTVQEIAIRPRLTVTTADAAVRAAVMGAGATRVLHYQAQEEIRRGALQVLLPDHEPDPVPIHLGHAARGQMPLKMRRFIDFAAPKLRAGLEP